MITDRSPLSLPQPSGNCASNCVPPDLPVWTLAILGHSPRPALLPSAQILKHLQEQKDSQCLHVEEYQNLVKDLRMELESVSEQKKNIMKGKPWASGGGG